LDSLNEPKISGVLILKTLIASTGCISSSTLRHIVASLREAVVKLTSPSQPVSGIASKSDAIIAIIRVANFFIVFPR
jgi:hypothetical protein